MNEPKVLNHVLKQELSGIKKSLEVLALQKPLEEKYLAIQKLLNDALVKFKGDKGEPGQDAKTPIKGEDYYTESEKQQFIKDVKALIREPKDADEEKIYQRLREIIKAYQVSWETRSKQELKDTAQRLQTDVLKRITPKSEIVSLVRDITDKLPKMKEIQQVLIRQKAFSLETALLDLNIIKLIARGLEKLKGKDKLSAAAIRGLPSPGGGGTTGVTSSGTNVAVVNISPQFDGLTTSFVIPAYTSILQFTITGWPPNGILLPTTDFTTPNATHVALVTSQVSAPAAGTSGLILYVPA